MDICKYPKQKEQGRAAVKKYGQQFQITVAQFDPDTGEQIAPVVQTITREQFQRERDRCAEQLAALDMLLADIDAAK